MKSIIRLPLIITLLFVSVGWTQNSEIELVESVPLETGLDLPEIRNTPDVWMEMIDGAVKQIDIETFYISSEQGEALDPILEAIRRAADRGVEVRIISEAKFYKTYPEPLKSLGEERNITVRIIDFSKIGGGVMHAKYFIVDGSEVFLGSQNFDWRALSHIHELGIRIKDDRAAHFFRQVFDIDWNLAQNPKPVIEENFHIHLELPLKIKQNDKIAELTPVFSPVGVIPYPELWDEPFIVKMMNSAKKEILIQLLTYSPLSHGGEYYAVLDNAIRRAASRGVNVRMICSDWVTNKPRIDFLKSLALVPNVEVKISSIPEFSEGFIPYARVEHCKYMVIDDNQFWLGTGNWSYDYFHKSRNVGVVVTDAALTTLIRKYFYNSWNGDYTKPIDPCKEYQLPGRN